jgi:hypothetical protein
VHDTLFKKSRFICCFEPKPEATRTCRSISTQVREFRDLIQKFTSNSCSLTWKKQSFREKMHMILNARKKLLLFLAGHKFCRSASTNCYCSPWLHKVPENKNNCSGTKKCVEILWGYLLLITLNTLKFEQEANNHWEATRCM